MSEIEFRNLEGIVFNGNTIQRVILNNETVWVEGDLVSPVVSNSEIDGSDLVYSIVNNNDIPVSLYVKQGAEEVWEEKTVISGNSTKSTSIELNDSGTYTTYFKFMYGARESSVTTNNVDIVLIQITKDSGVSNVIAPSYIFRNSNNEFEVQAVLISGKEIDSWDYDENIVIKTSESSNGNNFTATFQINPLNSSNLMWIIIDVISKNVAIMPCILSCTTSSFNTCSAGLSSQDECTTIASMGVEPCTTAVSVDVAPPCTTIVSIGITPCTTAVSMGGGVCTTAISSGSICTTTVSMGIGGGCGVVISSNSTGNEEETSETMELDMEDENE